MISSICWCGSRYLSGSRTDAQPTSIGVSMAIELSRRCGARCQRRAASTAVGQQSRRCDSHESRHHGKRTMPLTPTNQMATSHAASSAPPTDAERSHRH
jgi:hypothetical protein